MHAQLQAALECYRQGRRFDPARYVEAKSILLNAYFAQSGISACVVGVSGGVDSAVTLGLIAYASRQPGSTLRRVQAVLLPMYAEGATNQETASTRGAEVAEAFQVACVTIDLSQTLAAAREASVAGTGVGGSAWASGQLVSYLRTPMLYYQAALLTEQGLPAVVCGTTNRDEGSYIGFFGKASDGMVDLQPISDLHKSEVYRVAELLNVPHGVRAAVPTGDTYNGACDEEMIGAPYEALELYTWYLCACKTEREKWYDSLCGDAEHQFGAWAEALEKLHRINRHKYIGDSPAVHLDLYQRSVPDGWRSQARELSSTTAPSRQAALAARVGPVELVPRIKETFRAPWGNVASVVPLADFDESAVLIRGVLGPEICSELLLSMGTWQWVPADRHGRRILGACDSDSVTDGSYRATAYDETIARLIWDRLAPHLPSLRIMDELSPTDWSGHRVWCPVGVNPMLRFIRYDAGGLLVPHYDAGYDFKDGRRHTLMSVVFTLTPPSQTAGGDTRLLLDQNRHLPQDERVYADHSVQAMPRDVLVEVPADPGDALVFDHRLLHDGSAWHGPRSRILLRTDIIFERCAPHVFLTPKLPPALPAFSGGWRNDPTYRKAYEVLGSEGDVEEAGYFDSGFFDPSLADPRWWTSPFDKILERLAQPAAQDTSRELFVLVSTGAFCPVHTGHLDMMEQAKRIIEERGKVVLGGYLVPDHDEYILHKCGKAEVSATQRVDLCERAVVSSDWLMVERWAALHAPKAVNFTTIVDRIQRVLAYNVRTHRPIRVAYVFGSDNANFVKAFVGRGSCVCVLRPGYEEDLKTAAAHPSVRINPHIMFSRRATPPWASTDVRRGDLKPLPDVVKPEWLRLRSAMAGNHTESDGAVSLYVRNEGDWAVQPWAELPGVNSACVYQAYRSFSVGLHAALEQAFAQKLNSGPRVHVVPLHLREQAALFQTLAVTAPIISLDPCLPGTHNLAISRCYAPLSGNADPVFVARPGSPPLETQLACIPTDGKYVLFDDDSFSGRTAAHARGLLVPHCHVEKLVTLCDASGPLKALQQQGKVEAGHRPRLNLVDCRDFLAGAREAGLVLSLPNGTIGRAPYVLPYVRPYHRVSVPAGEEIEFSRRVWELNMQFFSTAGPALRVANVSFAYHELCLAQGFEETMTMVELCQWHIRQLGLGK
jgi:NAD+ synthetase